MNPLVADLDRLAALMTSRAGLIQLAVIALGLLLGWALSRQARSRLPGDIPAGSLKVVAGSFHRVASPLLALGFIWLGHILLAKVMNVALIKLAIPLLVSFTVIRLLVYLVRHLLTPSTLLKASERIIAYTMWAFAALYITGLLPEVETALSDVSFSVGKQKITLLMILTGLVTVLLTLLIAMTISRIAERRIMAQEGVSLSLRLAVTKGLQALAVLLAILIALPLVGIDLTVLSVFGGAIGVGLAFGLQKVASNYVSGFIILLERAIRVGDLVSVDSRHGVITGIHARYTVIRSLDGTEALLPNEMFITQAVVNHTFSDPTSSVKIPISVAYGADVDRLEALLTEIALDHPRVIKDPAPAVLVRALGDNGMDLELTVWIQDADQGVGALRSDLLRRVLKCFAAEGIEIPFPQWEIRRARLQSPASAPPQA
ncbi:MAG: mechanosensitive ion channel [Betaproteobacteria bacterium]|nr:mechanosensitive ion channel [Betaproteobacteria bacterium]